MQGRQGAAARVAGAHGQIGRLPRHLIVAKSIKEKAGSPAQACSRDLFPALPLLNKGARTTKWGPTSLSHYSENDTSAAWQGAYSAFRIPGARVSSAAKSVELNAA